MYIEKKWIVIEINIVFDIAVSVVCSFLSIYLYLGVKSVNDLFLCLLNMKLWTKIIFYLKHSYVNSVIVLKIHLNMMIILRLKRK